MSILLHYVLSSDMPQGGELALKQVLALICSTVLK